jgi:hypothetical protein
MKKFLDWFEGIMFGGIPRNARPFRVEGDPK